MPDTRVNLHVYTTQDDQLFYHVLHIGFFPPAATRAIVDRLNARGIAFHSGLANQIGRVDIVTCFMGPKNNPDVVARAERYGPPGCLEAA